MSPEVTRAGLRHWLRVVEEGSGADEPLRQAVVYLRRDRHTALAGAVRRLLDAGPWVGTPEELFHLAVWELDVWGAA